MRWRGLLLLLVLSVVAAQLPEWCEGEVACCIADTCEDCDCHLCVIAGGTPAGPNSTCSDECVCLEEHPPLCTNETLCGVAYWRCQAIPACAACFNTTDQEEFCRWMLRLQLSRATGAEEICESASALTHWLLYFQALTCPNCDRESCPPPASSSTPSSCPPTPPCPSSTPCPPPLPCPPDYSGPLALLLLAVTGVLACAVCFMRRPRLHYHTETYLQDTDENVLFLQHQD